VWAVERLLDQVEAAKTAALAEEAYRGIMTAYHRLDRPADVQSVYQRCREILESQLGVGPSAATEAALKEVRATT